MLRTGSGAVTVNATAALAPPADVWLMTDTEAAPGVAVRAADTTAVSCVGET